MLGNPYPLPVLAPEAKGTNLLLGVNYASAGAGILEDTGSIFVSTYTVFLVYCFGEKLKQLDFIAKKKTMFAEYQKHVLSHWMSCWGFFMQQIWTTYKVPVLSEPVLDWPGPFCL